MQPDHFYDQGTRMKKGIPKISAFVFIEEFQEVFVFKVYFKVGRSEIFLT